MDETLSGKEAYEAKKAAKGEEKGTARVAPRNGFGKAKPWIATILIAGAVGSALFFWIKSQLPQTPDLSSEIPIQTRDHIAVGAEHPAYNSNPPAGGWHYSETARIGFYDVGMSPADEHIVHNLEHGDIWIAYHPRLSEEQKGALKKFVDVKVLVAAREANDTDIALVAWGRLDSFNLTEDGGVPVQRIQDFITRYRNKGPESITSPQFHNL